MKTRRRILSLALTLLLLFTLVPPEGGKGLIPTAQAVTQAEIDSLKDEAKDLADQTSSLKSQLAELKDKRSSALERKYLSLLLQKSEQIFNTPQEE